MIQAALFVTAILSLLFGVVVFMNDPKSVLFRLYLSFSIFSALWMSVNAVVVGEPVHLPLDARYLFAQLITPLALGTSLTFYLFLRYFTRKKLGLVAFAVALPTLFVSLFAFSDLNVYLNNDQEITLGGLYPLYLLVLLLNITLVFYSLYSRRETKNSTRTQMQYLRLGAIAAIVPILAFGSILPLFSSSGLSDISPLFSVAFLLFAGIAMVKHHLFDIRLAAARAGAYFMSFAVILLFYTVVVNTLSLQLSGSHQWLQEIVSVVLLLAVALSYPVLKRFFDKVTNRIFYRDAYDPQEFLDQFNSVLVGNIDLDRLVADASSVIEKNLKCELAEVVLNDTEDSLLKSDGVSLTITDAREMRRLLESSSQKVFQIDSLPIGLRKLHKLMRKYEVSLIYALTPSAQEHDTLGYLMLGHKKSGNMYSRADERLLEVVANQLAIAAQNALRFQEIQGFSERLQREVSAKTHQLRRSNEKLRQLDEAKDEFLSMASHQLRTPLTSVKGFISMVLDGDMGTVNEQQRKVLSQAFDSSQNMAYLIADFLNVSRIQSGKFIIDKAPFDIVQLVKEEVRQLKETASARGLKLEYHLPANLPVVSADKDKLRQVMMNYMDNAIYYSPKGGNVSVQLYKDTNAIVFKVSDSGIGVPKEVQSRLFSKFFRADNARQQRPDGTGIGLYMAKKVIIGHGGSIIFESVEGKGSTFGFRLPLKDDLKKLNK